MNTFVLSLRSYWFDGVASSFGTSDLSKVFSLIIQLSVNMILNGGWVTTHSTVTLLLGSMTVQNFTSNHNRLSKKNNRFVLIIKAEHAHGINMQIVQTIT